MQDAGVYTTPFDVIVSVRPKTPGNLLCVDSQIRVSKSLEANHGGLFEPGLVAYAFTSTTGCAIGIPNSGVPPTTVTVMKFAIPS
jgi:hypothetical protein